MFFHLINRRFMQVPRMCQSKYHPGRAVGLICYDIPGARLDIVLKNFLDYVRDQKLFEAAV